MTATTTTAHNYMNNVLSHEPTFTTAPTLDVNELYYLLSMQIPEPKHYLANAAGDMNDDGEELKFHACIHNESPLKRKWNDANITEYERLFGPDLGQIIRPIEFDKIPINKRNDISYYNPQCKTKDKPDGIHCRIRGTFGGDRSKYTGKTASYQAEMSTVKLLLNKTVSDDNSRWMSLDIVDMYLHTKLPDNEWAYMTIQLADIPQVIIDKYKIMDYVRPGSTKIYVEVRGALYGMKQSGYLAQQELTQHLANHGYLPSKQTPCLFHHITDDIEFTLITDDFGVRYGNKAAADKLIEVMKRKYPMTIDWTGQKYAGFNIFFDYEKATRRCEISMKGYITAVLKRFKDVVIPTHNVYSPEYFHPINYGSHDSMLTKEPDTSPQLSPARITKLQQITGAFLYYARGVDGTMRPAVDHLSSEQNNGTENTWRKAIRLLEYAATFPDATIVYYPSDMILMSNVDGSYLSELQARSRAAAFHYLGRINDPTFVNGPIECVSCIIPTVVTSAAETEYASLFIAGKSLLPLRYTLNDMNCIQPTTIMYSDNTTAKGIATNTCKQRRSKSIDMRYHWIRDRVQLKDFDIVWRAGTDNYIADYLTKIHPAAHVLKMRKYFVKHAEPTFSVSPAKQKALSG